MSKKLFITQSNYIPWKGYFDAINTSDEFIIYDEVQYTRSDWRNRNQIKTTAGVKWLTIPVETHGKFGQAIRDKRVSDRRWARSHWDTIRQTYQSAACFKETESLFADLYVQAGKLDFLSDVNALFLQAICDYLEIKTPFRASSDFEIGSDVDRNRRLVDICLAAGATDYLSGSKAKAYLEESIFTDAGIAVQWLDYTGYPEYEQLHPPFVHEVSIVDVILNVGGDARRKIKGHGP